MATKTETLTIKVTPEEKEEIKRLAEKEDVTVSKYLYRMLFPKKIWGGLIKMNEKIVYTRWLANELVRAGFPVVRIE